MENKENPRYRGLKTNKSYLKKIEAMEKLAKIPKEEIERMTKKELAKSIGIAESTIYAEYYKKTIKNILEKKS